MAVTPNDSLGAGQRDAMEFTLRLGHALNQAGYPADSLSVMLQAVSARLGLPQVESYSTATGLNLAFGPLRNQRAYLMVVKPGSLNLSTMTRLDELALEVMGGQADASRGYRPDRAHHRDPFTLRSGDNGGGVWLGVRGVCDAAGRRRG